MSDQSMDTIEHELADWLLAHDRGLTEAETVRFDAWLSQSPAHALAWSEMAPLWECFDGSAHDDDFAAMMADARAAQPARAWRFRNEALLRPRQMLVAGGLMLSAAVALVAGLWMPGAPKLPLVSQTMAEQSFATGYQPASYRLADGTALTLDAGSALTFVMQGQARAASLTRGRAFLDVHHDATHPFSITAGGATITDEGTQFGISSDDGGLSVTLVSGKVAIADPASGDVAVRLVPGQQFKRMGNAPGQIVTTGADAALSWREGYLEFDRVPLTTAIARINQYTGTPLLIGDPSLGQFLVSGRFKAGDPERFARILALTYPVRLTTDVQGHQTLERRN